MSPPIRWAFVTADELREIAGEIREKVENIQKKQTPAWVMVKCIYCSLWTDPNHRCCNCGWRF